VLPSSAQIEVIRQIERSLSAKSGTRAHWNACQGAAVRGVR
jgi:hypothetical protein